jgi:4'-phosphopantetheinyl transferase
MDLNRESVQVCWINASYDFNDYNLLYHLADEEEKPYINRYRSFESRYDSLLGLALSKYLLAKHYNKDFRLTHNEAGKPFFREFMGHVSITHSSGVVAAVLSTSKIGLDLETYLEEVDEKFFLSDKELERFAQGKDLDAKRLTTLWTLKEAYVKAIGTGFYIDPKSISFKYTEKGWIEESSQMYFYTTSFKSDMVMSICSERALEYNLQEVNENILLRECFIV